MWSHFKEQKPLCNSNSASLKEGWIFQVVHRLQRSEQDNNQDFFCIPFIDEIHGARYFSKLDLRSRYYQIGVRLEEVEKTSLCTHEGYYEFKVMTFLLTNAPTTFQAAMNELFHPYLRKFVLVFFDDMLIYRKTWREHLRHLDQVLTILEEQQFFTKMSKCTFGKE